jgi:hypothetical protein
MPEIVEAKTMANWRRGCRWRIRYKYPLHRFRNFIRVREQLATLP